MFATVRSRLIRGLYSAKSIRFYAQTAGAVKGPQRTTFDRSMIRPFVWVIVFGSLVTHVIDQRQAYADMEKRYKLKTEILERLVERARSGDTEVTYAMVEEELELVNKMFVRDKSLGMKEVEAVLAQMNIAVPQQQVADDTEESLEDIWQKIVEDAQRDIVKKEVPKVEEPEVAAFNDIVMDKDALKKLRETERDEAEEFTQSTDQHLIVENPGDLSGSTKFL